MIRPFDSRALRGMPALLLVLGPAAAPALHSEEASDETYMGEAPDRYAQVKVLEGDIRIRKGDAEEALVRTIPVAEGDVVESRGRGVLQLGDGSRIAFGENTRFQVAGLFMDKNAERQVLLRLDNGRIRIGMARETDARIRVDTPSGVGVMTSGSASFEVTADHTLRLRVHTGRVNVNNESDHATIGAGERLTVYGDHDQLDRIRSFSTYDNDGFDTWCERNLAMRRGESYDRVPTEIRYYADDLDGQGDWTYIDDCASWCWRPRGVSEEWRPYWNGRWASYPGGMTWIASEPWGFVTSHFGRWGWRASFGWYWIPGAFYSPAWVAWHSTDEYIGWAPMGYYNAPCTWGFGAWGGGFAWNVVPFGRINVHNIHSYAYRDPGVIRRFNPGPWPSDPGWTHRPGGRPLTPPWKQGPLIVRPDEFRNPSLVQHVIQDRVTVGQRLRTYEDVSRRQTGRTIFRQEGPAPRPLVPGFSRPTAPASGPAFEDRSRLRPGPRSTVPPGNTGPIPPHLRDREPIRPPQGRPAPQPDRRIEARPELRQEAPKERPRQVQPDDRRPVQRQDAPRQEPPRQEPQRQSPPVVRQDSPRERPRIEMQNRPEPPRQAPRETPREAPRERPRVEARDEPRREAPREVQRPSEVRREAPREAPRQIETRREAPKESPRESPREAKRERDKR